MEETETTVPRRIALIEKYQEEIRIAKETLKVELDDSPEYKEAELAAKEANRKKKQIKDEIWGKPSNRSLRDDIQANTEEIATLQEILSAELMQIFQEKNVDEVPDENGQLRKFKVTVKLLPKGGERERFGQP